MLYLDSSALVKLVADEPESPALRRLVAHQLLLSSEIAEVEVTRAARRYDVEARGVELLEKLARVEIDDVILASAGAVDPVTLSALDAVHLASALFARERIERFVAYDERLLDAARASGLPVASPSWAERPKERSRSGRGSTP